MTGKLANQTAGIGAEPVFPVRPRDWVMCGSRVARVRAVHHYEGELLADLVIYSLSGDQIGRESPVEGGPKTFEPMCSLEGWERCSEPSFPMELKWVPQPGGGSVAKYWSKRLPPANYRKPKQRSARAPVADRDEFRVALERIARGHNDPRTLAAEVLNWNKQVDRP